MTVTASASRAALLDYRRDCLAEDPDKVAPQRHLRAVDSLLADTTSDHVPFDPESLGPWAQKMLWGNMDLLLQRQETTISRLTFTMTPLLHLALKSGDEFLEKIADEHLPALTVARLVGSVNVPQTQRALTMFVNGHLEGDALLEKIVARFPEAAEYLRTEGDLGHVTREVQALFNAAKSAALQGQEEWSTLLVTDEFGWIVETPTRDVLTLRATASQYGFTSS